MSNGHEHMSMNADHDEAIIGKISKAFGALAREQQSGL